MAFKRGRYHRHGSHGREEREEFYQPDLRTKLDARSGLVDNLQLTVDNFQENGYERRRFEHVPELEEEDASFHHPVNAPPQDLRERLYTSHGYVENDGSRRIRQHRRGLEIQVDNGREPSPEYYSERIQNHHSRDYYTMNDRLPEQTDLRETLSASHRMSNHDGSRRIRYHEHGLEIQMDTGPMARYEETTEHRQRRDYREFEPSNGHRSSSYREEEFRAQPHFRSRDFPAENRSSENIYHSHQRISPVYSSERWTSPPRIINENQFANTRFPLQRSPRREPQNELTYEYQSREDRRDYGINDMHGRNEVRQEDRYPDEVGLIHAPRDDLIPQIDVLPTPTLAVQPPSEPQIHDTFSNLPQPLPTRKKRASGGYRARERKRAQKRAEAANSAVEDAAIEDAAVEDVTPIVDEPSTSNPQNHEDNRTKRSSGGYRARERKRAQKRAEAANVAVDEVTPIVDRPSTSNPQDHDNDRTKRASGGYRARERKRAQKRAEAANVAVDEVPLAVGGPSTSTSQNHENVKFKDFMRNKDKDELFKVRDDHSQSIKIAMKNQRAKLSLSPSSERRTKRNSSPRRQRSPGRRGRSRSPRRRKSFSPRMRNGSPRRRRSLSPLIRRRSPLQRSLSPWSRMRSPRQRRSFSPRIVSPPPRQRRSFSPRAVSPPPRPPRQWRSPRPVSPPGSPMRRRSPKDSRGRAKSSRRSYEYDGRGNARQFSLSPISSRAPRHERSPEPREMRRRPSPVSPMRESFARKPPPPPPTLNLFGTQRGGENGAYKMMSTDYGRTENETSGHGHRYTLSPVTSRQDFGAGPGWNPAPPTSSRQHPEPSNYTQPTNNGSRNVCPQQVISIDYHHLETDSAAPIKKPKSTLYTFILESKNAEVARAMIFTWNLAGHDTDTLYELLQKKAPPTKTQLRLILVEELSHAPAREIPMCVPISELLDLTIEYLMPQDRVNLLGGKISASNSQSRFPSDQAPIERKVESLDTSESMGKLDKLLSMIELQVGPPRSEDRVNFDSRLYELEPLRIFIVNRMERMASRFAVSEEYIQKTALAIVKVLSACSFGLQLMRRHSMNYGQDSLSELLASKLRYFEPHFPTGINTKYVSNNVIDFFDSE